eukprot:SM000211S06625  [mRNA]  locus=s211:27827:31288:- [translate_table: standard]
MDGGTRSPRRTAASGSRDRAGDGMAGYAAEASAVAAPEDLTPLLAPGAVIAVAQGLPSAQEGPPRLPLLYAATCDATKGWLLRPRAGLSLHDPAVHVVVVSKEATISLRSGVAEGRLLQCSRLYELCFRDRLGDQAEEWEVRGHSLRDCVLRNSKYKLALEVTITIVAEPIDLLGNALLCRDLQVEARSQQDEFMPCLHNSDIQLSKGSPHYLEREIYPHEEANGNDAMSSLCSASLSGPCQSTRSLMPQRCNFDVNYDSLGHGHPSGQPWAATVDFRDKVAAASTYEHALEKPYPMSMSQALEQAGSAPAAATKPRFGSHGNGGAWSSTAVGGERTFLCWADTRRSPPNMFPCSSEAQTQQGLIHQCQDGWPAAQDTACFDQLEYVVEAAISEAAMADAAAEAREVSALEALMPGQHHTLIDADEEAPQPVTRVPQLETSAVQQQTDAASCDANHHTYSSNTTCRIIQIDQNEEDRRLLAVIQNLHLVAESIPRVKVYSSTWLPVTTCIDLNTGIATFFPCFQHFRSLSGVRLQSMHYLQQRLSCGAS